ncbi:hypothetical protein BDY19DRAFT_993273, partial [Irpex rosettiformis]
ASTPGAEIHSFRDPLTTGLAPPLDDATSIPDESDLETPRARTSKRRKGSKRRSASPRRRKRTVRCEEVSEDERSFWGSCSSPQREEAEEMFVRQVEEKELLLSKKSGSKLSLRPPTPGPSSTTISNAIRLPLSTISHDLPEHPPSCSMSEKENHMPLSTAPPPLPPSQPAIRQPAPTIPQHNYSISEIESIYGAKMSPAPTDLWGDNMDIDVYPGGPHEPTVHQRADLSFARPSHGWERPIGSDPFWWYDDIPESQRKAWGDHQREGVLVRIAGAGCPLPGHVEKPKKLIRSIIELIIGPIVGMKITEPRASHTVRDDNEPPHSFLIYNIDSLTIQWFMNAKCLSTPHGTLFFEPIRPLCRPYLFSVEGFTTDNLTEISDHINQAFDDIRLNDMIKTLLTPSYQAPFPDALPLFITVDMIRASLRLSTATTLDKDQNSVLTVHIFMDPPTHIPANWRAFQDHAGKAKFTHNFFGANARKARGWICKLCLSCLHPTENCFLIKETGWFLPPGFSPPSPSPLPTLTPETIAETTEFTTAGNTRGRGGGTGKLGGWY